MKFYYSGIEEVFNVCHEYINTIIIENQKLFSEICKDIYYQIEGNDGRTIVSIDNATIDIEKNVEKFILRITENMEGNLIYSKLSISNIIKSLGIEFEDYDTNLCEKIIDYMELVREYDHDKLFIFVNLRSYITDYECIRLYDTILRKQFHTIMIDNCEHDICPMEKRIIVDKDNCVIK